MSHIGSNGINPQGRLGSIVNRLTEHQRAGGLGGTVQFLRRWAQYKAHYHLYDRWFEKLEANPTSKGVRARDLDFDEELRRHAVEYLATPRLLVHTAIRRIPEPLDEFTFIDIGSGLGRPLLAAAEHPFKAVIGYELSPSLHQGALANIERTRTAKALRGATTSVNANALEADWPKGSRAFFLFNPFDREFMRRFLTRARDTALPGSRNYFLFLNLKEPDLPADFSLEPCPGSPAERMIWRLMSPYPLYVYRYDPPAPDLTQA
jgi:hypothetical protein